MVNPTASFPPDLVGRRFDQDRITAVWSSDIPDLSCGEADMYLCAIGDVQGAILHSDRGSHTAHDLAAVRRRSGRMRRVAAAGLAS